MDLLMPLTTLSEWVWCAAQVGAAYVELCLFAVMLGLLGAIGLHMYRWQKKILLAVQSVQLQMEENSKAESLMEAVREVKMSMTSMTGSASGDADAPKEILSQLSTLKTTDQEVKNLATELGVLKKHLLEILSQIATLKTVATEVTNFHKLLNTVVSHCGKLGGMYNRVTETHGLVIQKPSTQQHEASLEKLQKSLEEYADRLHKTLSSKVEDLSEKTAILRVVMDQKHEKQCVMYKDLHGSTCSDVRNLVSLVRGLEPVVPELKKLVDMVASGREASNIGPTDPAEQC